MRNELEAAGTPAEFVMVHGSTASSAQDQKAMIDVCAFPILQDEADIDVWSLQGGGKDDLFVYDRQGKLATYFPAAGPPSSNLSTAEGYKNVKDAVLAALAK